jgi:hypothetical protein
MNPGDEDETRNKFVSFTTSFRRIPRADLSLKVLPRARFASFHSFQFHFLPHMRPNLFCFDSQSLFNSALESSQLFPPTLRVPPPPHSYSFVPGVFVCWLFVSLCNLLCSTHFIAFRRRKIASALLLRHLPHVGVLCEFFFSSISSFFRFFFTNNKISINYSPNFMNFYSK